MKDIIQRVKDFANDRPILKQAGQNNLDMIHMIRAEVNEAEEVANDREKLAREIPDIIIFCVQLAINNNIDLTAEIMEKLARNQIKYLASDYQEGDYQEARRKSRADWTPMREDEFYSI